MPPSEPPPGPSSSAAASSSQPATAGSSAGASSAAGAASTSSAAAGTSAPAPATVLASAGSPSSSVTAPAAGSPPSLPAASAASGRTQTNTSSSSSSSTNNSSNPIAAGFLGAYGAYGRSHNAASVAAAAGVKTSASPAPAAALSGRLQPSSSSASPATAAALPGIGITSASPTNGARSRSTSSSTTPGVVSRTAGGGPGNSGNLPASAATATGAASASPSHQQSPAMYAALSRETEAGRAASVATAAATTSKLSPRPPSAGASGHVSTSSAAGGDPTSALAKSPSPLGLGTPSATLPSSSSSAPARDPRTPNPVTERLMSRSPITGATVSDPSSAINRDQANAARAAGNSASPGATTQPKSPTSANTAATAPGLTSRTGDTFTWRSIFDRHTGTASPAGARSTPTSGQAAGTPSNAAAANGTSTPSSSTASASTPGPAAPAPPSQASRSAGTTPGQAQTSWQTPTGAGAGQVSRGGAPAYMRQFDPWPRSRYAQPYGGTSNSPNLNASASAAAAGRQGSAGGSASASPAAAGVVGGGGAARSPVTSAASPSGAAALNKSTTPSGTAAGQATAPAGSASTAGGSTKASESSSKPGDPAGGAVPKPRSAYEAYNSVPKPRSWDLNPGSLQRIAQDQQNRQNEANRSRAWFDTSLSRNPGTAYSQGGTGIQSRTGYAGMTFGERIAMQQRETKEQQEREKRAAENARSANSANSKPGSPTTSSATAARPGASTGTTSSQQSPKQTPGVTDMSGALAAGAPLGAGRTWPGGMARPPQSGHLPPASSAGSGTSHAAGNSAGSTSASGAAATSAAADRSKTGSTTSPGFGYLWRGDAQGTANAGSAGRAGSSPNNNSRSGSGFMFGNRSPVSAAQSRTGTSAAASTTGTPGQPQHKPQVGHQHTLTSSSAVPSATGQHSHQRQSSLSQLSGTLQSQTASSGAGATPPAQTSTTATQPQIPTFRQPTHSRTGSLSNTSNPSATVSRTQNNAGSYGLSSNSPSGIPGWRADFRPSGASGVISRTSAGPLASAGPNSPWASTAKPASAATSSSIPAIPPYAGGNQARKVEASPKVGQAPAGGSAAQDKTAFDQGKTTVKTEEPQTQGSQKRKRSDAVEATPAQLHAQKMAQHPLPAQSPTKPSSRTVSAAATPQTNGGLSNATSQGAGPGGISSTAVTAVAQSSQGQVQQNKKRTAPLFTINDVKGAALRPPLMSVRSDLVVRALHKISHQHTLAHATPHVAPFLGRVIYDPFLDPADLLDGEVLRKTVGGKVEIWLDTEWLQGEAWEAGAPSHPATSLPPSPNIGSGASDFEDDQEAMDVDGADEGANKQDDVALQREGSPAWTLWDLPPLRHRKIWGTDVYTDDSDILAACIHSGWLRLGTTAPLFAVPAETTSTAAPAATATAPAPAPAHTQAGSEASQAAMSNHASNRKPKRRKSSRTAPVSHRSLRITIVIAPRLIRYEGSLRAGVRSRSWGNSHDGVSYAIESVEMVERAVHRIPRSRLKSYASKYESLSRERCGCTTGCECRDRPGYPRVQGIVLGKALLQAAH